MRRWVVRIAAAALLVWGAAIAGLLIVQRDLIYPFRDFARADLPVGIPGVTVRTLTADDGMPLTVWVVEPRRGRPVILHFTGNAGSLASSAPRLAEFVHHGYGLVALNYRGAGGAPGQPTETALTADALLAYDAIPELLPTDEGHLPVIYGTSLGAAVAVQVAARRPAGALVLETPFARLCETAGHHYPLIAACLVMFRDRWDSLDRIGEVSAPVLILHGDADRIIPVAQARRLHAAAPEPKRLIVYEGGRHNDLRLHGAGVDVIAWLDSLARQ